MDWQCSRLHIPPLIRQRQSISMEIRDLLIQRDISRQRKPSRQRGAGPLVTILYTSNSTRTTRATSTRRFGASVSRGQRLPTTVCSLWRILLKTTIIITEVPEDVVKDSETEDFCRWSHRPIGPWLISRPADQRNTHQKLNRLMVFPKSAERILS